MHKTIPIISSLILLVSCSTGVVTWQPGTITDTSSIVITCDATKGNRGLYNYKGDVFVQIAVITDLSTTPTELLYLKFIWNSQSPQALARSSGENKWNYSIPNIRNFFEIPDDEKILKIAVAFRSACIDSCYQLKNKDGSDTYIPVNDTKNL